MPDLPDVPTRYASPPLVSPGGRGYLHLAADVDAPARPGFVFHRSAAHRALVAALKAQAAALEQIAGVTGVTVFDAVLLPPPGYYRGEWGRHVRPPHFDVAVLVEAVSPEVARGVQRSPAWRAVVATVSERARRVHALLGHAAKRLGDVDLRPGGVHVFHYLAGEDPATAVRCWDPLAGWYAVEAGLANGALLVPVADEPSDYVGINHARFDMSLLRFVWRHLSKESWWREIRPWLEEHHVEATPTLYRVV
jgi:hypothetical protein